MSVEAPAPADRGETARLVLNIGLAAALLPLAIAAGAWALFKVGALSWQTAYGVVLVGDGGLSLALQASVVAILAALTGLGAALWAGPEKLYSRAMLNVALAGAGLWLLMLVRG